MRTLKEIADATADHGLARGLDLEAKGFLRCLASADGQEGVAAFLERRSPRWIGA
jgi:enoyl-CoA hydratase/carnithine racemase